MVAQFGLASLYPRSIAWLIYPDEWERFEQIIKYNCTMVGGYFNVIIPVSSDHTLSAEYQRFLAAYDPDIVVLAPGMKPEQVQKFSIRPYPFGIVAWDDVPQIAILDPRMVLGGMNVTQVEVWGDLYAGRLHTQNALLAVADAQLPDASRLALVACGEVEAYPTDDAGYRELFLQKLQGKASKEAILSSDRYQLALTIAERHQFPLSNPLHIMKACLDSQFPLWIPSFIGLTGRFTKRGGTPRRMGVADIPSFAILVSEHFGLEEAALFWNLRASKVYVAWLSLPEFENNLEAIVQWLDSSDGGLRYWRGSGKSIVFSAPKKDCSHLHYLIDRAQAFRGLSILHWHVAPYKDLIVYDYLRPSIRQERVFVSRDQSQCSFISTSMQEKPFNGVYAISLEWNSLVVPQSDELSQRISPEVLKSTTPVHSKKEPVIMPRFRISKHRFLSLQMEDTESLITFNKPSPEEIVEVLFTSAGFQRVEPTSTARYHRIFVERARGLDKAADYLASPSSRILLETLADNSKKTPGWLLDYPSRRRSLNHLHLLKLLNRHIPPDVTEYFNTISDQLPEEVVTLLEKSILERGFLLKCKVCSYESWYPVEHVRQTFECGRCFQAQVYADNPLWLYKLPEVIFQGFADNMQVPLLALNSMRLRSKHSFEWIADSNIFWMENGKERHQNLDILCICDGKFYIGEAKSNDEIKEDQFSFYERVCRQVTIDGIIFATSKRHWKRGTLDRIERLRTAFEGEVIILSEQELYPGTSVS